MPAPTVEAVPNVYIVPHQSEHTLRAPVGVTVDANHGIMHTVTQNEQGVCCTRTAVIPVDPKTGIGSLHIDASTLLKTVGTAHPDIHNMTGIKIHASESHGMTGPSGVTFAWGDEDNQVPLDTTTRQSSHTPDRTDLWHHLAHDANSKMTSEAIEHNLQSGFATPEQVAIAASTMAWDKSTPLEHHPEVTDIGKTHKMFPKGTNNTLAAMVLNKNEGNPLFFNGLYKPDHIDHPETGVQMTVVKKEHYDQAVKLAADAREPKHMLGQNNGITITTQKIHDSIKATAKNPIVTVQFSTLHNDALSQNAGLEMSAHQLKSVISGASAADGPIKAADVPNVMSREALADHVVNLLKLDVAAG